MLGFQSEDEFAQHVKTYVLPIHSATMRGKRGGPGRRKAREVKEEEADELAKTCYRARQLDMSRAQAIQAMRENYGFVEWLFFGWQIFKLIMMVVEILYPTI